MRLKQQRDQQPPTQPTEKKNGWSDWKEWDTFPHAQIQLGISNTDYGGMMDMEYQCFGEVGTVNRRRKSQTYWYRIANQVEDSQYVSVEVGCYLAGQFKASFLINGLIRSEMLHQVQ